ncbi:MAG: sigma-70 family RNA polymerase sigma factor [Bacteroidaceae bacterium]|nr:sigma-70 family RNA polymerase sigma factor [Bacteroidaceae bacterium]
MDRLKYISLVTELRQIAVARAMSLFDDKDDAEDVAGEVLLKLWERHKDLRDNADQVRHLADRMARNLALNLLQHRRRHPILRILYRQDSDEEGKGNIPDIPDWSTPQQYIEDKEANSIGQRAMSQLPYNWRRIVEMREREDMSFAEIAQVMGTSESSCRGMMSKARQRMLQLISIMTR